MKKIILNQVKGTVCWKVTFLLGTQNSYVIQAEWDLYTQSSVKLNFKGN